MVSNMNTICNKLKLKILFKRKPWLLYLQNYLQWTKATAHIHEHAGQE